MEDLQIIDCLERIRNWLVAQDSAILQALTEARCRDYRRHNDGALHRALAARVYRVNPFTPAGKRDLAGMCCESAMAAEFRSAHPQTKRLSPAQRQRADRSFRFLDEHASDFVKALDDVSNPKQATALVRKHLPILSPRGAYAYLADIGYPAMVPGTAARRFFHRIGLADATTKSESDLFGLFQHVSKLCRYSLPETDLIVGVFTGGRKVVAGVEPPCGIKPRCQTCPAQPDCQHFRHVGLPEPRTTKSIKNWSEDERPRERLLAGKDLSNTELLAMLIRTGSPTRSAVDIARDMLDRFDNSLYRLVSAPATELLKVRGIGTAKAAEIRAALELGKRAMEPGADERSRYPRAASSDDIASLYRARFQGMAQEQFVLIALNSKNRVTRDFMVSLGTLNASIVHPRDVFRHAVSENAAAVIFVHNHPSGDPAPSNEDRALTRRLAECGKLLGIRVLDHVIVGAQHHYSFADHGELADG